MTAPAAPDTIQGEVALVVGLGNPGLRYAANRHNLGAMVTDLLAGRIGGKYKSHKGGADIVEGRLAGRRVVLARPRSYMNVSGAAVVNTARFFGVTPSDIVVVHDEIDLDLGVIKLKRGGGEGGHNGLRSISTSLGTKDYLRVRLGVGRPPGRQDPADYVLRDFGSAERTERDLLVERGADAVEDLLAKGLVATQNQYHAR